MSISHRIVRHGEKDIIPRAIILRTVTMTARTTSALSIEMYRGRVVDIEGFALRGRWEQLVKSGL